MERIPPLLPLFALAAMSCAGTLGAAVPDPFKPPEPAESAAIARAGKLAEFRDSLGDVLATRWRPSQSGRPGSSAEERFAKWVDLYGFVDLLVSDEDEVSRRWIARHLEASGDNSSPEERKKVTILTPGSSLPGENDPARQRILDEIAGDPSLVERVLGELVAPPFSSRSGPLASRLHPPPVSPIMSRPSANSHASVTSRRSIRRPSSAWPWRRVTGIWPVKSPSKSSMKTRRVALIPAST